VTAPGVRIVSTRTLSPIGLTGIQDPLLIEPQYLPWYTALNGTSMAAPHVAGIAALMLDANPDLDLLRLKTILQQTATPLPYATWEAGAGYVDAFAAVSRAVKG
jgi:serine protease AprX